MPSNLLLRLIAMRWICSVSQIGYISQKTIKRRTLQLPKASDWMKIEETYLEIVEMLAKDLPARAEAEQSEPD